jgi:hypothetical protein
MRAQRGGSIGGSFEGDPRLAGERIGLGTLGSIGACREVVAGQGAGQLVGPERLEEPGGRQMEAPPR